MTMERVHAAHGWILPSAAVLVTTLAVGARLRWLFWDEPITNWVVHARTDDLNNFFKWASRAGSTEVVFMVSSAAAALAWHRCRPLAIAILVIAFARPVAEWTLKELVDRDRPPVGDRLNTGTGESFPSGHPLAAAASWGTLPLVAALYTGRRLLWWTATIAVWSVVALTGISRVWLGVHWASDVVAGLALAVLGVALAERLLLVTHRDCRATMTSGGTARNIQPDGGHMSDPPLGVLAVASESRFVIDVDGIEAELLYRIEPGRLVLIHTEVPDALGGRGLGGQLVLAAIARARADNLGDTPAGWPGTGPTTTGR